VTAVPIVHADSGCGALAQPSSEEASAQATMDEWCLVDALRAGDEAAFIALIGRHHAALVRLARLYVPARVAEDLVQDVWAGMLSDLDRLSRVVSLRVSLFTILLDRARTRRPADAGALPFAAQWSRHAELDDAPVLDPSYFRASGPWVGHWAAPVPAWADPSIAPILARELHSLVEAAMVTLPPAQREVVTLRDVEGWTPDEVSSALGIAATTQRALLHHGRTRIRAALDACLQSGAANR
jgi:RNA polymerase sigma-70 factor (ECF subfamily)